MSAGTQIASLIAARICHDLVNPMGAIGNGLELMELSGVAKTPEMQLMADSLSNAHARLKVLRLAFGPAAPDQPCALSEVRKALAAYVAGGRLRIDWQIEDQISCADARLAILSLLCLETVLPLGGSLTVSNPNKQVSVRATGPRIVIDPLFSSCLDTATTEGLRGGQVQFALLPLFASEQGRKPALSVSDGDAVLVV